MHFISKACPRTLRKSACKFGGKIVEFLRCHHSYIFGSARVGGGTLLSRGLCILLAEKTRIGISVDGFEGKDFEERWWHRALRRNGSDKLPTIRGWRNNSATYLVCTRLKKPFAGPYIECWFLLSQYCWS